jgi:hypothetical protein
MREVYFETENAILRFYYDDVVERLPYYESTLGTAEATTLRNLLSQSDQSIRVPREQYRFAYFALDLIKEGKGAVYCKACKRYYEAKDLKRVVVGNGESPFSVNVKGRGLWKRVLGKKQKLPLFGGKGYQCSEGQSEC